MSAALGVIGAVCAWGLLALGAIVVINRLRMPVGVAPTPFALPMAPMGMPIGMVPGMPMPYGGVWGWSDGQTAPNATDSPLAGQQLVTSMSISSLPPALVATLPPNATIVRASELRYDGDDEFLMQFNLTAPQASKYGALLMPHVPKDYPPNAPVVVVRHPAINVTLPEAWIEEAQYMLKNNASLPAKNETLVAERNCPAGYNPGYTFRCSKQCPTGGVDLFSMCTVPCAAGQTNNGIFSCSEGGTVTPLAPGTNCSSSALQLGSQCVEVLTMVDTTFFVKDILA